MVQGVREMVAEEDIKSFNEVWVVGAEEFRYEAVAVAEARSEWLTMVSGKLWLCMLPHVGDFDGGLP